MKLHLHVGVVETVDEATLEQAIAVAKLERHILARLAPNVAVLETADAERLIETLEYAGLHPRVSR